MSSLLRTRPLFGLLLGLVPACVVLEVHEGNGVPATDERDVGPFDGLANESLLEVRASFGEVPSVSITCDENLVDLIQTTVEGGVLTIRSTPDKDHLVTILPHTDCVAEVVTTGLVSVASSGSGDVELAGGETQLLDAVLSSGSGDVTLALPITTARLDVVSSGSGDLRFDAVRSGEVAVLCSGSGDVQVDGTSADRLDLVGSGSGSILARELVARDASVVLSGSGDAEITVTESLEATLTGSGDLTVWGQPADRDITETGSGEVRIGE